MISRFRALLLVAVASMPYPLANAEAIELTLRHQLETSPQSGRYHRLERRESWEPTKTAIIVCDMWDSHHCYRAVQREKEFAPRLNQLLVEAREQGATILHAPSGCMDAYQDHPARQRAIRAPAAADYPENISSWCYSISAEEAAEYPIDQSDGGEDDTPEEHARWEAQLRSEGRDVNAPWQRQIDVIEIDPERDFISDQGKEVWNVLQDRGIEHVILTGVHTNMCVLGRPFGLRRMAMAGKNVVLMRDLTDTMYNPQSRPFVSHFSGTDLIIDHIERHVCPTITSDQVIGGEPFRFADDNRPHVAIVISEPEYETQRTLPRFAESHLRRDHRITMVFGSEGDENGLPGIELVDEADVLLLSVRRRSPPRNQLAVLRRFVQEGKPVLGIRTASHAFSLRSGSPPEGADAWPEFDAEVFGGNYSNHYGKTLQTTVAAEPDQLAHPILHGISSEPFAVASSLYVVSPLKPETTVLMRGQVEGHPPEPVAWTFTRSDGGRSFYTSLGAPGDFELPLFPVLLRNGIEWAVGVP